jgi:2-polyprenyl-3-methyl-5-hydroxy-6-metoxy-1,4-benzoquinol methylase
LNRSTPRDHYSYTVYADTATAESFDERRFGGPIGQLVAEEQARVLRQFVGSVNGRAVLDVGTGTGRAAILMAEDGATVTGVDASEQMLAVARRRVAEKRLTVNLSIGDVHHLDFPDRSFDSVIGLRLLMHTGEWRRSIAELCRVANRLVLIDYPAACSVALFQATARRLIHAVGGRTEPYRVFSHRAIARELVKNRFRVRGLHRQFVLPIALYKAIGSRRFTEVSNRSLDQLGLLGLFGTPVTLVAERCES